jgi:hypothetical protein
MQERSRFWQISARYGIYTALMILFFYLLVNLSGLGMTQWLNLVGYLILGIEIYFAQKAYREHHQGVMTFGRGLSIGLIVSLSCGLILGGLTYIYLKFINKEAVQTIIDQYRRALETEGLEPQVIQELMNTVHAIFTAEGLFLITLIGLLFSGLLLSLVVTVFSRRSG